MKWPKKRDPEEEAACLEYLQRMAKQFRSEADYIEKFLPSPDNVEDIEKMVDDIEGDLMRICRAYEIGTESEAWRSLKPAVLRNL